MDALFLRSFSFSLLKISTCNFHTRTFPHQMYFLGSHFLCLELWSTCVDLCNQHHSQYIELSITTKTSFVLPLYSRTLFPSLPPSLTPDNHWSLLHFSNFVVWGYYAIESYSMWALGLTFSCSVCLWDPVRWFTYCAVGIHWSPSPSGKSILISLCRPAPPASSVHHFQPPGKITWPNLFSNCSQDEEQGQARGQVEYSPWKTMLTLLATSR